MKRPRLNSNTTSKQIAENQRFTILELLDRLLDKGVMVKGEILLSVADIDLVYLNLGLLLSSVKTVEKAASGIPVGTRLGTGKGGQGAVLEEPPPTAKTLENNQNKSGNGETFARTLPSVIDHGIEQVFKPKANIDPKNAEKGLSKLVLTLVDLIRKLMEKQAVRKIEAGFMTAGEIDRVGNTFLLLDERMEQLKKTFGLKDEDLNLDLGPLGELL